LRKLLKGAVIASATLALTGGAIAQVPNEAGNSSFDATIAPKKVGTKKKPKSHALRAQLEVNRPGTTVETITLKLGKGFKFSGKGFKKCSEEILLSSGPSGCPAGSKAGPAGTAAARLEPGNGVLNFNIAPFVGDANTFLIDVDSEGIEIHSILKGELTNRGRTMTITIPKELRQPLAGIDATLTAIDQRFVGKSGKNAIFSSTNCKKRKVSVSGTLGFAERQDGAVVPPNDTMTEKVKCSK
jgi:hypothetical protein